MKTATSSWHLFGFPVLLVAACIMSVIAVAGRPGSSTTDFLVFYQSGRQFLAGMDPYLPFVISRGPNLNPPWVVAIMAQLSRAPLPVAVAIWWAIGYACFAGAMALIAKTIAPARDRTAAIACAVLVTQAAYANMRLGQVAWPLLLLLTAAWRADRTDRPIVCGILLGVAASWKPFLLVFVPYLVWRRAWTAFGAMAASVAVTTVAGLLIVGGAAFASWITVLQIVGWEGHPLNASLRGVITRALTMSTLLEQHTRPIVDAARWRDAAWLAASMVVAVVTVLRVVVKRDIDVAWAALGLLALLISPLGWVHYVPIVTGPVVAALIVGRRPASRLAVIGWVLLCVPFVWLKTATFGAWLTLTVASAYAWGTLLLLAAILLA